MCSQGNALENHLNGGPGNDRYVFDADSDLGSNVILEAGDPSGGIDTLDFTATTGFPITIDLSLTARQTVVLSNLPPPDDIFFALELRNANSVENVIGGALADQITGNDLDNALAGELGNDVLKGGVGNDVVVAVRDADFTLTNTTLKIGSETDTLTDIESAALTDGLSANTINASAFTAQCCSSAVVATIFCAAARRPWIVSSPFRRCQHGPHERHAPDRRRDRHAHEH